MTITLDDLRNDQLQSGFHHVTLASSVGQQQAKPYQARYGQGKDGRDPGTPEWRSPRRATAEEAASDYVAYVNGSQATPATPALKSAGHKRVVRVASPAVQAARQALRDALAVEKASKPALRGYIYLAGETFDGIQPRTGALVNRYAVKVGYSDEPPEDGRMGGLQTGNPRVLVLLGTIRGYKADEDALHAKYIEDNVLQEWFRPTRELLSEFGVEIRALGFNSMWAKQKGEA